MAPSLLWFKANAWTCEHDLRQRLLPTPLRAGRARLGALARLPDEVAAEGAANSGGSAFRPALFFSRSACFCGSREPTGTSLGSVCTSRRTASANGMSSFSGFSFAITQSVGQLP
jgi:hypothetical protein